MLPEDLNQLQQICPKILTDQPDDAEYNSQRQVFNRRFQKRPAAIVLCTETTQVAQVVEFVNDHPHYPLRVKSGGHDHEAECSATDGIVIDFSDMNHFSIDTEQQTVTIQPGVRFKDIIPSLDEANVSIPHGTCESVGVFGFTLGGGWGPWTRLHGMCCEHLIGATIVLGDGSIKYLGTHQKEGQASEADQELLWALRGGGGFSYGILTEITLRTFQQPPHTLRFTLAWALPADGLLGLTRHPLPPAIKILKRWEEIIAPGQNEQLIGTNLKIMAIPEDEKSVQESVHDCIFYGYYAGTEEEVLADLNKWFHDLPWTSLKITTTEDIRATRAEEGANSPKARGSFSSWDRISIENKKLMEQGMAVGHFPPDTDGPAPHKISSRLVKEPAAGQIGLGPEGRINLIKSLRSDLIYKEGIKAHLHTYVTLGAISGHFYNSVYQYPSFPNGSAFPYQKRPYTIQYQVWWDTDMMDRIAGEKYHVYDYTNRAMDWIQHCRNQDFPQTSGAFISFKDSSIPTSTYFDSSYHQLKKIKEQYSKDVKNIFHSRKTIY